MLAEYRNGNCLVSIFEDGTKIREWEDTPHPEFPESIDLKITDSCMHGCRWCHEKSLPKGLHSKTEDIRFLLCGLPAGVEIAIGGGNPILHPDLKNILSVLSDQGLIGNLTVHARDLDSALSLKNDRLIYGLGVSWDDSCADQVIKAAVCPDVVVHFVSGIHNPNHARRILDKGGKILVLGYKWYGRGLSSDRARIEASLKEWTFWMPSLIGRGLVSFDNLALSQIPVKDMVSADVWTESYMGDDGLFTMYIDAVNMQYAVSSTSNRLPLNGFDAIEAFESIQKGILSLI